MRQDSGSEATDRNYSRNADQAFRRRVRGRDVTVVVPGSDRCSIT
ncbi:hypothetical protein BN903_173 [Halorubrum sp. AJ67]|nr:hypothetical protein BN903_173 [Halorubrum sp. AJ67]